LITKATSGTKAAWFTQILDYAYCRTIHSAQGATVETAYVAASRETLGLEIITDNIARLSAAWAVWSERAVASSLRAVPLDRQKSQQARAEIVMAQAAARQAEVAAEKALSSPKLEPEPALARPRPGIRMGR
jgi:ATP-dependent exoDNAse (exonuclease V) alpha subunit